MGLIPGMPNLAFLTYGAAVRGRRLRHRIARQPAQKPRAPGCRRKSASPRSSASCPGTTCSRWICIGLEVGYRLVPLVDKRQSGELLARIRGVRRKLSQDLGFLVQAVHIRDNLDLAPNAYRISLGGVPVGEGVVYPDRELAINPGPRVRQAAGHRDPRSGIRHGSGLDRARRARACADARLHGGRCRAPSSPRI